MLTHRCLLLAAVLAAPPCAGQPQGVPPDPIAPGLTLFSYRDVTLTGGPLADQLSLARRFYLDLPEDRLLHGFRTRAGLPAPGGPMGGWYDPEDFAGAHPFGQFISALARMAANSRDVAEAAAYRDKVARLVHGFHETIAADGFFYSSQKAARDWGCYIYDKNCTGMRDAATLASCPEALEVLKAMTDWAERNLPARNDEWYTLPANLYECQALTGEARYLELARRYDYSQEFYDTFAAGGDAFGTERHAYSHVNALLSATRTHTATGDRKYLNAATRAWDLLTTTQSYSSGGWGPNERFVAPGGLAASLGATHNHFETPCGTYATVNLDRALLALTGRVKYADSMERVLFNGMLASLPPQPDGRAFYYSDYSPGAAKTYFPARWPCCAGTYGLNCADYPLDIYAQDERGPIVLLFVPSRVTLTRGDATVTLDQSTGFPRSGDTMLTVHAGHDVAFALGIRVPAWSTEAPTLRLNDAPIDAPGVEDGILRIARTWRDGDTLAVHIPMGLRYEAIDTRHPGTAAVLYGPILLVVLADGEVSLPQEPRNPRAWLLPVEGRSLTFRTSDGARTLEPFYSVTTERYTTYLNLPGDPVR